MWRCQANLHYSMLKRRTASQRPTLSESSYNNEIGCIQRIQFLRKRSRTNDIAIIKIKLSSRLETKCALGDYVTNRMEKKHKKEK